MVKKRGAKPDFTLHPDTGKEIEGLYTNRDKEGKVRFYYYLDEKGRQKTCTSDIRKAIKRLNAFREKNRFPDMIEIPEDAKLVPIGRYGAYKDDDYVNKTWIIEQFQKVLNDDRKLVVDVSGNSNYWDFENTPSRPKSVTCKEVLEEYLALKRKKPLNADYRYRMIREWNRFTSVVNKTQIRDVTFDDVKRYKDLIYSEAEQKHKKGQIKRPDLYVNAKFDCVHDTLVKMRPTQEYKTDINNLLDHMQQLIKVVEDKARPKAITPEQWDILYTHSKNDLFIRCGLLLGLNCAMTWGDIIDLTIEKFDFRKRTYIGTRSKNDIQNCAMLFPETAKCLKQYIKENPTQNGTIFYFKQVTRKSLLDDIGDVFNEWKSSLPPKKFKKVEQITQSHLRISVRTTAKKARCHIEYIKLVMGRQLEGSEESYTEKDALMTKDVLKAVHRYYFPKK
jgi:integrase